MSFCIAHNFIDTVEMILCGISLSASPEFCPKLFLGLKPSQTNGFAHFLPAENELIPTF